MNEKNTRKLLLAILAVYALLVFITIYNHEQWRDEGGDWMTLRDISLPDLMSWWIPQAGHAPLFYLILFPFAKMGLPMPTVSWFSGLLLVGSLYILFFRSRLPLFLKLAICCSYFILYEYPVIGRPYCVTVLFASLVVALYPQRFEKPWLYALAMVGLFNSDTVIFPFAFALSALYFIEMIQYRKFSVRYLLPLLFMGIGGAYLIPYIALPGMHLRSTTMVPKDPEGTIKTIIGNALFLWSSSAAASLLLVLLLGSLVPRPKALFLALVGCLGIIYIFSYKYTGDMRHHGMIVLILLCAFAIADYYTKESTDKPLFADTGKKVILGGEVLFALILFFQIRVTSGVMAQDINGNFTGGKDAAEFLMDNNLEHKLLIGHTSWAASSVLQYLPKDVHMFYPDCNRYGTYIIYDSLYVANQFAFSGDYAPYIAETKFRDSLSNILLVMNMPISDPGLQARWKPIYFTADEPIKRQESYIIYKFEPGGVQAVNQNTR